MLGPLAEQGNVRAQSILGAIYHQGEGVPQDDAEAMNWVRRRQGTEVGGEGLHRDGDGSHQVHIVYRPSLAAGVVLLAASGSHLRRLDLGPISEL